MSTFRYRAENGEINIACNVFSCVTGTITNATYGSLIGNTITANTISATVATLSTTNINTATISTGNITTATIGTANVTTGTITTCTIGTAYVSTANLTNANIGIILAGSATVTGAIGAGSISVTGGISAGSASVTGAIVAGSSSVTGNLTADNGVFNNGITTKKTSSTKDYPILSYQSALAVGQSTSLLLGVAGTLNNSAEITFNYTGGTGSNLNSIGLGLFGNENKLTLTPTSVGTTLPITTPSVTFSPSTIPFKYSEGTWTPQFKYVTSAGAADPLSTITYSIQSGTYTRIGNQVTVYYNIAFTSLGADLFVTSTKFMAVGNLPFKCNKSSTVDPIESSSPMASEIPNGFSGMAFPPGLPVFPPGRVITILESGTSKVLTAYSLVPVNWGTWIADGYTAIIEGNINYVIPVLNTLNAAYGQIYNFWIASAIVTYPMSMSGSLTYYTDDPY